MNSKPIKKRNEHVELAYTSQPLGGAEKKGSICWLCLFPGHVVVGLRGGRVVMIVICL